MNEIFLPELHKIEVNDFSLYRKDISYDFVHGVNLIIGGNGLGKTTFINTIKYGLIGLYSKDLAVRTYMGEKRSGRRQYSMDYFKSRMATDFENNKRAEVILTFSLNKCIIKITRDLYNVILKSVEVTEDGHVYYLQGEGIKQDRYERTSDKDKEPFLQFQYEKFIEQKSNIHSFNDFIFFVNEILFFDEDRKTIIWDPEIQARLSSKYFNDPKLDAEFQESKRQARYFDSIARHKSEDMRAINKIIKRIESAPVDNVLNLANEINKIKRNLENKNRNLNEVQTDRKKTENSLSIYHNTRNKEQQKAKQLEQKIREEEAKIYEKIWEKINDKYKVYLDNLKHVQLCPMCNQGVSDERYAALNLDEDHCFVCHQELKITDEEPIHLTELKQKLEDVLSIIQGYEREIYNYEDLINKLDKEYRSLTRDIFTLQSSLRDKEHNFHNENNQTDDSFTYRAMQAELEELEKQKKENTDLSTSCNKRASEIFQKIEGNLIKITKHLSEIFSDFAGDFLGVDCQLTYDDLANNGSNMYVPIVEGKARTSELELSESQRFFTDQSFRMSLLNFFYTMPSFFVCETPDSSLDLSYEENAATIFLKYLNQPNSLIITSNLNNSEFLEKIIEKSINLNLLNLLDYGRTSAIQAKSEGLQKISKRIEDKVNARN